jgi:hypothetical protein
MFDHQTHDFTDDDAPPEPEPEMTYLEWVEFIECLEALCPFVDFAEAV